MKTKEIPVCGLAAVEALYSKNPDTIKRLFFDYATSRKVAKISRELAKTKRIYRVVESHELEKIAGTVHHGGIVAVVEARGLKAPTPEDIERWAKAKAPLLLLDRIGNAHNLGAIVRTAAFLGVERIVIPNDPKQALPGEAAHRVAEGGMEHVELYQVDSLPAFCRELAVRYQVIGTSLDPRALALDQFATKDALQESGQKPAAVVLGNEETGLSREVAEACTKLVKIPGTGRVESLNVSAAAAILIWVFFHGRSGTARNEKDR